MIGYFGGFVRWSNGLQLHHLILTYLSLPSGRNMKFRVTCEGTSCDIKYQKEGQFILDHVSERLRQKHWGLCTAPPDFWLGTSDIKLRFVGKRRTQEKTRFVDIYGGQLLPKNASKSPLEMQDWCCSEVAGMQDLKRSLTAMQRDCGLNGASPCESQLIKEVIKIHIFAQRRILNHLYS